MSSDYTSCPSAKSIEDAERRVNVAALRGDLNTLHRVTQSGGNLAGNGNALGDRGVLAVLDPRMRTKGYGRRFIASVPPAPVVHDLDAVERFFSIV